MKKQNTFSTGMAAVLWSSLILLLLFLDQFTKHEAFLYLKPQDSIPLIPGVLELSYVENRGWHLECLRADSFCL